MNRLREKKTIFIIPVLLLMVGLSLSAQDSSVFAPFASRLKTAVKDNAVKLTWTDSNDVGGKYRIYRSSSEITDSSLKDAKLLATVDAGTGSYIDSLEIPGDYYYAVLIEENGEIYRILVPYRNTLAHPVTIRALSPEETAVTITGIQAAVKNSTILLTFTPSRTDKQVIVYRNTKPISTVADLSEAAVLEVIECSERFYVDIPVPGVTYYYIVADKGLVEYGKPLVKPGENATVTGISIPLGQSGISLLPAPSYTERTIPVPTLILTRRLETGERFRTTDDSPFPEKKLMNSSTGKAASFLLEKADALHVNEERPEVFSEDRIPGKSAEEATLYELLTKTLLQKKFEEAYDLLANFLTKPRSESVRKRTRFYMGQCLYFMKKYDQAVLEYVIALDLSYETVQPWIDRALLALARTSGTD